MKKLLFFICLILIFSACSSYNYKSMYHAPSILFDETVFYDGPENRVFYVHDGYGRSHRGRSISIDSNSMDILVDSPEPIDLPEELVASQANRKNEVHVFVNDSILDTGKRLKFQESDIKEVLIYSNASANEAVKSQRAAASVALIALAIVLATVLIVVLVVNAAVSSVSDGISSIGTGVCYIATMSYGSYEAPEVIVLRKFRDEKLRKTFWGRVFISNYYVFSPLLVKLVKKTGIGNKFIRRKLDRFVHRLKAKHHW